ncbi:MAG: hypothetical protein M1834_008024 [Cirrosporium novae-zelandiae]|nr:MAG: hypothetical protein M1834_008024 [Cirrosporium novae-zelandiae]
MGPVLRPTDQIIPNLAGDDLPPNYKEAVVAEPPTNSFPTDLSPSSSSRFSSKSRHVSAHSPSVYSQDSTADYDKIIRPVSPLNVTARKSMQSLRASTRCPSSSSTFSQLPFSVLSQSSRLASGFPYNSSLFHLRIPPDVWSEFSEDIVNATTLSLMQHVMAASVGVTMGLGGLIVSGTYVAREIARRKSIANVKKALQEDESSSEDNRKGLPATLRRWNQEFFKDIGLEVSLEIPLDAAEREAKGKEVGYEERKNNIKDEVKDIAKSRKRFSDRVPIFGKNYRDERRFRIVITSKDDYGTHELEGMTGVELDSSNEIPPISIGQRNEMPAIRRRPVELPTMNSSGGINKSTRAFAVELDAQDTEVTKPNVSVPVPKEDTLQQGDLIPRPLSVRPKSTILPNKTGDGSHETSSEEVSMTRKAIPPFSWKLETS